MSKSVTYTELFESIKQTGKLTEPLLRPVDINQRRSLELLQQFIEVRSGGPNITDLVEEARLLNEWRELLERNRAEIDAFFELKKSVTHVIKDRMKRLEPLIGERLAEVSLEIGWVAHGGGEEVWNAYFFPAVDWSVELKFSSDPSQPALFVYDYEGRGYKEETASALRVDWAASDDEITEAFLERVQKIVRSRRNSITANLPQSQDQATATCFEGAALQHATLLLDALSGVHVLLNSAI